MTDLGFFCILTFVGWSESPDDIRKLRGVAQVVERYFREVEAASSSLVTPMEKAWYLLGFFVFVLHFVLHSIKVFIYFIIQLLLLVF